MEQEYLWATIRQTSRRYGLAEYYLRKLYHEGRLPHIRCGVKIMIDVPSLMEQLRQEAEKAND